MTLLTRRVLPSQRAEVAAQLKAITTQLKSGNLLDLGDKGAAVSGLQKHLRAAGVYSGKITGTFDEATQAAVSAFQAAKKLPVTGVVNGATVRALKTINLEVKDNFETAAKVGQRGTDVLRAERMLEKLGYRPGEADGVFDEKTRAALLRFRKADKQVPDTGNSLGAGAYQNLKEASRAYDHAPFRRRDRTDLAAHTRLDLLTSRAAAKGTGVGLGAEGKAVANIEQHLEAAGYDLGTPNSKFSSRTEAAVKAFQRALKLPETGRVDARTWKRLKGASFEAKTGTSPAQREGEISGAVKRTEKMLQSLGYNVGRVDGHFTEATETAVRRFQKKHGLKVSGHVGDGTMSAIERATRVVKKPAVISRPSPNHSSRGGADIDSVVLHHTASNNVAGDLATLRSPAAQVSAHYLIGRDGKIYQLVADGRAAWHAGVSHLHGDQSPSVNARSIGIEITNAGDGKTKFTEAQYKALEKLVPWLHKKYKIPLRNLVGHKDVALPAGRKSDPASNFDFGRIRRAVRRVV